MPRKQGKAISESNGPVPYHDEFGSREPMMADLYRMFEKQFDRTDKNLERMSELTGMLKVINKRLAGLEHEARQPRLAPEADAESASKTRKRTEDAAVDRAKHEDKSSAARVDHDSMRLISLGDD